MTRILIDQDNTIYDIDSIWLQLHNEEYPNHILQSSDLSLWDRSQNCRDNNCKADIYKYLEVDDVWTKGMPIEGSTRITQKWIEMGHELAIVTSVPYSARRSTHLKYEWLKEHFSHIPNILTVNNHIKHWVSADFMIDDAIHNLDKFEGISILFNAHWNQESRMVRAKDWNHVEHIVQRGIVLLKKYTHKFVEQTLKTEIAEGIL